jgi:3-hydroxyacyl-CoA dehydrogenase
MTTSPVSLSRDDGIVVITIDNPPVNALSHVVRQALFDAAQSIAGDTTVKGVILAPTFANSTSRLSRRCCAM